MKHRFASVLLLLAALFAGVLVSAQTASLAGKGNSDFTGGEWTKLNNDYAKLPSGAVTLGGVEFDLARGPKSCLLLGGSSTGWQTETTIVFDQPLKGKYLYLLHTFIAEGSNNNRVGGRLKIHYTDGSSSKEKLTRYISTCPWGGSSRRCINAVPVWGEYAVSGYVEAQVSKFELKGEVRTIEFIADYKRAKWAVFGISAGPDRKVAPLTRISQLTEIPKAAVRFSDEEVKQFPPCDGKPRNIVLIIGDGMGLGALNFTSNAVYGQPGQLLMEQFPCKGLCETYSASSDVTDSAASGTAIAGGYKTTNGYLGVTPDQEPVRTIAEEARDAGKSVGLLTTDKLTGATPSAFAVHVPGRSKTKEILADYAKCNFDFLLGAQGKTDDYGAFAAKGYTVVNGTDAFLKSEGKKVIGSMDYPNNETLAVAASEMLKRLNANPKGFFAMIECSWPDGGGHGNNPDRTVKGVTCVDHVVRAAAEFARTNPDTLIVVTADHETGGIVCTQSVPGRRGPFITYQCGNHTGAPVGIFAVGPGAQEFGTVLNNINIAQTFAKLWGLPWGRPVR